MNPFHLSILIGLVNTLPVMIWGSYFLNKHNEKRKWVLYSFSLGSLTVIPLVFFKEIASYLPFLDFQTAFNNSPHLQASVLSVPLAVVSFIVVVAIIEEYFKHKVADTVDKSEITSIDDAIEFSIMAALGFAFAENTFYLINIWQNLDIQTFWSVYLLRAVFSTFAHCLFSTIYGYYFGLSLFADKVFDKTNYHPYSLSAFLQKFHIVMNKTFLKKIFATESQFIGLFYASIIHSMFNIALELQWNLVLVPFVFFGLSFVNNLINSKKNIQEMI